MSCTAACSRLSLVGSFALSSAALILASYAIRARSKAASFSICCLVRAASYLESARAVSCANLGVLIIDFIRESRCCIAACCCCGENLTRRPLDGSISPPCLIRPSICLNCCIRLLSSAVFSRVPCSALIANGSRVLAFSPAAACVCICPI